MVKNNTDALLASMKKREFVIGLATVVVAAVVVANLSYKNPTNKNQKTVVADKKEQMVNPKGQSVTPTPATNKIKEIKQLADTSGENMVVVQNGDNYYQIAKRVCGNGRLFLSVQAENGNKALQPGDTVMVSCN